MSSSISIREEGEKPASFSCLFLSGSNALRVCRNSVVGLRPRPGEGLHMTEARVLEIIRHFRENGLKLLLQHPGNARDLLALSGTSLLDRIDFARMTVDPTSYIASDYRHLASD